jgi:hypothetical protein
MVLDAFINAGGKVAVCSNPKGWYNTTDFAIDENLILLPIKSETYFRVMIKFSATKTSNKIWFPYYTLEVRGSFKTS